MARYLYPPVGVRFYVDASVDGIFWIFYLLNVQYWIVSNAFGLIVRFVSNESNDFSGPPNFSLIFLGIVLRSSVYTKTQVSVIKRRAQRKALPPCSSKL